MKKLLAFLLLAAIIIAADLKIGSQFLRDRDLTLTDTITSGETLFTEAVNIEVLNFQGYVSLRVKLDTINGESLRYALYLQEGYDKTNWEWLTFIDSVSILRDIDTVYEINLYPTPYFRFYLYNKAGSNDSIKRFSDGLQLFVK